MLVTRAKTSLAGAASLFYVSALLTFVLIGIFIRSRFANDYLSYMTRNHQWLISAQVYKEGIQFYIGKRIWDPHLTEPEGIFARSGEPANNSLSGPVVLPGEIADLRCLGITLLVLKAVFPFGQWRNSIWLCVPFPMLLLASGMLSAIALHQLMKSRYRTANGCCLTCGYDLRGSVGYCPECGTVEPEGQVKKPLLSSLPPERTPRLKPVLRTVARVTIVMCLGKLLGAVVYSYLRSFDVMPPKLPRALAFMLSYPLDHSFLEGPATREPLEVLGYGLATLANALMIACLVTMLLLYRRRNASSEKSNGDGSSP
jgi:hypothetical protein